MFALVAAVAIACANPMRAADLSASTEGKPAGASSYEPGHLPGGYDASGTTTATGWAASTAQFPQWLVVDLGAIYTLTKVQQTFAAVDTWSYKIEGSNDDNAADNYWTTLAVQSGGQAGRAFSTAVTGNFRYVRLYVTGASSHRASSVNFTVSGTRTLQSSASVPKPQKANTGKYLVGAQSCNLWANKVDWQTLQNYPDRISIMGTYDESYDVSTDWQIKMAVEHGISFMQGCWFRLAGNEAAHTVLASYDHFLDSVANSAKYRALMQFSIDWINVGSTTGTTSGVSDFVQNLVPYWINTYMKKPNYLKIDGKPVLAIYDFEQFINQMGSLANAQLAIRSFRSAVTKAGFPGLILETQQSGSTTPAHHWVIGNDPRGVDPKFGNQYTADYNHTNADAAAAGFDYVFAYHVPTFTDLMTVANPTVTQVSDMQRQAWDNWLHYSALPSIVSASMGWNAKPWDGNPDSWQLAPADFKALLISAKTAMAQRGAGIPSRLAMLDSWNEYAEGHYIAPTKGTGYGYLDAVGAAFSPNWPMSVPNTVDTAPVVSKIPQITLADPS
jgi:hypothetical protein